MTKKKPRRSFDNLITRDVTLREMLDATAYYSDDEVFRWFQASYVSGDGKIHPHETLRLTIGQVRREIGWTRP
jgi:hypothetical protein